jgi:regulatory protein
LTSSQRPLKQRALRLLARRDYGIKELANKLRHYFAGQPEILMDLDQVMAELIEQGWVCDQRFTQAFMRQLLARGQGPLRIVDQLSRRGIDQQLIADCLAQQQTDWLLLAQQVRIKRFGATLPTTIQDRAKQSRFLSYRGFSVEQIHEVLNSTELD